MNVHLIIHNTSNDLADLHKSLEQATKEQVNEVFLNFECIYLKSKMIYETAKEILNV